MTDSVQQKLGTSLQLRPALLKWLPEKPALHFEGPADDPAALRAWHKRARKQFEACLGDPIPAVPPRPRVLERRQMDGYRRITFTLATGPSLRALCWLLLPDGASDASPLPAMIATPGHGLGGKDILAMDDHWQPRPEGEGYQKDYALAALRQGVAVLVIEPLGFGERQDPAMRSGASGETGCHAAFTLAAMLGTSLARIRIHDVSCGVDYLQGLSGIDPNRIGMMGISGGGQLTLMTTAIETRLRLAIVSGYISRFRESVMGMHHCICNFVPGLAKHFEMSDLAMMVAPRPLLIQSGIQDPIFPIAGARSAHATLRRHYQAMGHPDRLVADVFNDAHIWSPTKVAAFLDRWL